MINITDISLFIIFNILIMKIDFDEGAIERHCQELGLHLRDNVVDRYILAIYNPKLYINNKLL
jgi:hypothetical protein